MTPNTAEAGGRLHLAARYADRIDAARARLAAVWRGENADRPALILSDVNYALCGQYDIPPDYLEPAVMFDYQMRKIERHLRDLPDDYVPVLHPWYGTTVVPSALGAGVAYFPDADPSLTGSILRDPADLKKLKKPDPYRDGQMPRVLACIDYMKARTDVPVCVTDCQGPFNIALSLAGVETLFAWMYEEPDAVHELMDFCTDVLIDWVKVQKEHAGHALDGDAYPHAIELPRGFGGVAFSDDDVVAVGAAHYREFVAPYNERLLAAFGGGSMHFCGSARHQIETVSRLRGLTAVNNFSMGDFDQLRALQSAMRGRGAVMACDFNAEDPDWQLDFFRRLAKEDPRGLVCAVFVAPRMALRSDGKYADSDRRTESLLDAFRDFLPDRF